jgi:2'-5' RNA ligase
VRLFVALDLPETVKAQLALLACGLPGARWEQTAQLHLTVRFIGEADGGELKEIRACLAAVCCQPFPLQLKGIGFFPPRQEPHTLWVGLQQSEPLFRLRNTIESALKTVGLGTEERKFIPHVTLARLRGTPSDRIGSFLAQHSLLSSLPFPVSTFRLCRSVLGPNGAKHYVEEEYPLAG